MMSGDVLLRAEMDGGALEATRGRRDVVTQFAAMPCHWAERFAQGQRMSLNRAVRTVWFVDSVS